MKKRLLERWARIQNIVDHNPLVFPVSLLILGLTAYAPFIFFLGFYWDDWPPIALFHVGGNSAIWQYFQVDRPFQSWTYMLLFPLCQESTVAWQLAAIIFRWTTALVFASTFSRLFPKQKWVFKWAAMLFVVFPGFSDQFVAVVFSSIFLTYTVFVLSLYFLVLAFQSNKFWLFYTLSLLLTALHLFTMEYFAGLEVLRVLILVVLVFQTKPNTRSRAFAFFKTWLPFLGILAAYLYWRLAIFNQTAYLPTLLPDLLKSPAETLLGLFQTVYSDLRFLLISSWTDRLLPADLDITRVSYWVSIVGGVVVAAILVLPQFRARNTDEKEITDRSALLYLAVALTIILFGVAPVWSKYSQITAGKWSDRFGLAAFFGVGLLISTLLFSIVKQQKVRNLILILLVGLSIGYQVRMGNDYRKDYRRQKEFYLEMAWRMPSLAPGTTLYSPTTPTIKETDYSYSMGINVLYGDPKIDPDLEYWMSGPRYYDPVILLEDPTLPIEHELRNFVFEGTADRIVSVHMPQTGCLWVIDPYYARFLATPRETTPATPPIKDIGLYGDLTNFDMISDTRQSYGLSRLIDFSAQNTWCYFFEKADLAQSQGRNQEAIDLFEKAVEIGLEPVEGIEYLPFIKAYTASGQLDRAVNISQLMTAKNYLTRPMLCQYWADTLMENPNLKAKEVEAIYNPSLCPDTPQ